MKRSGLFLLVFGSVVALSVLIALIFVPDFRSIAPYRVAQKQMIQETDTDGGHLQPLTIVAQHKADSDMLVYIPVHSGQLAIAVAGQDYGQSALNDLARISRRKLPTALYLKLQSLPDTDTLQIRVTQLDHLVKGAPPAIFIGPAAILEPVVAKHYSVGPVMRASVPVTAAYLFLLTLVAGFLSRSPARYLCMVGVFSLQFVIELDDQLRLGIVSVRTLNSYISLSRDLLILYSFNLWFDGPAFHREIAFWAAIGCAFAYTLIAITLGSDSAINFVIFALRTIALCSYCAWAILTTGVSAEVLSVAANPPIGGWIRTGHTANEMPQDESTSRATALALFGVWMTSNLAYLAYYSPTASPEIDFFVANYVNASMVLSLTLLVLGGISLEWRRYCAALDQSNSMSEIVAGHTLELDQRSRALQAEIEQRAVLDERQRFTRDMHDGIGGQLLTMLLKARQGGANSATLERDIEQSIHDLRLVTAALDGSEAGVSAALENFKDRSKDQLSVAGMKLEWKEGEGTEDALLGPRETLELLRVLQEAMTNAIRHSGGSRVSIAIHYQADEQKLMLSFSDNGRGMDDQIERRGGLRNIEARIAKLGGTISIISDGGLWLNMIIPCEEKAIS